VPTSATVVLSEGAVVEMFTTGTVAQVSLLADSARMETWSGNPPVGGG